MARGMSGIGASTGAHTEGLERVEIVTRGAGRRSFSAETKVRLVTETFQPGATVTAVSLRQGIRTSLLHRWRRAARGEVPSRRAPAPKLLPVRVVAPEVLPSGPLAGTADTVRPSIEVLLRNGRVLRVEATVDAAAVARLAAALEA